jgi:hypothetical protein
MNELEKLQVLLPHWIEHNRGHAEECGRWADLAGQEGGAVEVALHLKAALASMKVVSEHLEKAFAAAGGAKVHGENDHHHHHH